MSSILAQIPLVVKPGSFSRPKAVSLPYDLEELPETLAEYSDASLAQIKQGYSAINGDQGRLQETIGNLYKDGRKTQFEAWEKGVRMIAPGYIGQDGSVGVMSPTKRA